jgi:hypothetical protein
MADDQTLQLLNFSTGGIIAPLSYTQVQELKRYLEQESPTDTSFYMRPAFGLLMSLNMLIEFGDAFDFSGAASGTGAGKQASNATKFFISPAPAVRYCRISTRKQMRPPL